jgi:hypothetical protein
VSECFNAAVARSPLEAAEWWLVTGIGASCLVTFCVVAGIRRKRTTEGDAFG